MDSESEFACDGELIVSVLVNHVQLLNMPLFYDTLAV